MSGVPVIMWFVIGFCILVEAARELCFKQASNANNIVQTLRKPLIWVGILLWGIELLTWTNVLEVVPLTIAFPVMSLVYVVVLFGSALLFGEKINRQHLLGAFLITAGAAIVGSTGI